jgi:predicted transcriptional regulator
MRDFTAALDSCGPLHKKYRGHFEIVALLLEAVKDSGATCFSMIKYTGTNYKLLKKYLSSLIEIGFIEIDKKGDQCLYRISEKGLCFLRQYYILLGMLLVSSERNNAVDIVHETGYDSNAMKQQSLIPLVARLRHNRD